MQGDGIDMNSEWRTESLEWSGIAWLEITGKQCHITLEPRPAWCDRGNYIAKLFPIEDLYLEIDEQDGFPRYYFDQDRAKLECEAWLKKRGQWIP